MIEADRYAERVAVFDTPGGHPITMHYRDGTNDWNTLTSSLTEDEYQLPQGISGHAVDVGGYLGSVGIALALDNPNLLVTIIEPVPPNADLIERNIEANGVGDRVTLIRGAVGSGVVEYGFHGDEAADHHTFVGNSSLGFDHAADTVVYTPMLLSEFTGAVSFLKIDCEGGEWEFFGEADEDIAIPLIVGEAHAVDGHMGIDIIDYLPDHDVTLIGGSPDGTCGFRAVLR
jgi:FkbM family methyltransferase